MLVCEIRNHSPVSVYVHPHPECRCAEQTKTVLVCSERIGRRSYFFREGGEEHTICFENNSSVPRDGSLQVMTESTIPRILIVRTSNSPRIDGLFRICLMTTMVPEYRYLSFYFYRQRRKEKKETLVDTTSLALSSPRGLCLQRCASLSARPRTYLSSRAHP